MPDAVFSLERFPVHLGRGATAVVLPEMDGTSEWFDRYTREHGAEGADGRLVSMYTFTEPWTTWEVHPDGHELVLCVSGEMTLHQEVDGEVRTVRLAAGEAVINAPGVWHTADLDQPVRFMTITPGEGTEHRPR
jgi:quercetin dioxygenase-like cupin family protein